MQQTFVTAEVYTLKHIPFNTTYISLQKCLVKTTQRLVSAVSVSP